MSYPPATPADWRALVEKELAGGSFEKSLVHKTVEGLSIQPLYTASPAAELFPREPRAQEFRICMRHAPVVSNEAIASDVGGGAEALWLPLDAAVDLTTNHLAARPMFLVMQLGDQSPVAAVRRVEETADFPLAFALDCDPIASCARGTATFAGLSADLATLAQGAGAVDERFPSATGVMVSTLPYHDTGADCADELAIALSTGARYLGALLDGDLSIARAARQITVQIAIGRDTFLELCKVRALRACWQKLLVAAGVTEPPRLLVHAVCSSRTMTVRDPWVNMLRATTQVFSAVLGGADLVTPTAFDEASGAPSPLGRRVARNTGLVLREESFLGKVADPAGGSYYLDTLTDALAREAWSRFRDLERNGGIVAALESGRLQVKLESDWTARLEQIAKRRAPIVGVSEFANLDEILPRAIPASVKPPTSHAALGAHHDAEAFEALRAQVDAHPTVPEAVLITLGTLSESRPRAGFAAGFFSAGGIRTRESNFDEKASIACLCGTDERYGVEAMDRIRALKSAGCTRVLVAGRPGALEPTLRAAGADGFIFVGCDVVATLTDLIDGLS